MANRAVSVTEVLDSVPFTSYQYWWGYSVFAALLDGFDTAPRGGAQDCRIPACQALASAGDERREFRGDHRYRHLGHVFRPGRTQENVGPPASSLSACL